MKKLITTTALLLTSLSSLAFTPESGHYWDPDASGSGYTIEIQDNTLFGSFYVYDDFGNPIWYTTSGTLDGNAAYESFVAISYDGQCVGCPWTDNTTVLSDIETVKIEFLTETTATIEMLGQVKTIERFNFFLGDELQKMRGEWQLVYDVSDVSNGFPFFADVLVFEQTETFNGDYIATGCRSESTAFNNCTNFALNNNDLAASYDFVNDELIAVVRDDADYYLAYYLTTGTDQFDGEAFSYLVGSSPNLNNAGFPVRGFRTASKTFVDTGTGPSKTELDNNKKNVTGLSQMIDAEKYKNVADSGLNQSTQARILNTVKRLEAQLKK